MGVQMGHGLLEALSKSIPLLQKYRVIELSRLIFPSVGSLEIHLHYPSLWYENEEFYLEKAWNSTITCG